jgi:hypothetical protein
MVGMFFFVQVIMTFSSLNFILTNLTIDDAYYYFSIAHHIAHGFLSSFDGTTLTNGYHPLWVGILTVVYWIGGSAVGTLEPIQRALLISCVLNAGSALLLIHALRRTTRNDIAVIVGTAAFVANPFVLYELLNGMETSLFIFLILLLGTVWSTLISRGSSFRSYVLAGGVFGLLVLSRLDAVLYAIPLVLWLIYQRIRIKHMVIIGASAAVLVVPYAVWNLLVFHAIIPSSGVISAIMSRESLMHSGSVYSAMREIGHFIFLNVLEAFQYTGLPIVLMLCAGFGAGALLFNRSPERTNLQVSPTMFLYITLGAGYILVILANLLRLATRDYYFAPSAMFAAFVIGWAVDYIVQEYNVKKRLVTILVGGGVLIGILSFAWSWGTYLENRFSISQDNLQVLRTAQWVNENVPKNAKIGAFDAGIVGWFSGHQLFNLDGLVNQEAYKALLSNTLMAYILQEHISYVIAPADYLEKYEVRFGGLDMLRYFEPIHSVESIYKNGGPVNIYRIVGSW